MSKYCIAIDTRLCSGLGACVDLAPALFRLEAGGVAAAVTGRDGRSRRPRGSSGMPDGRNRRHRGSRGMTQTVLIAGAGLGGSRCAETLRARGWQGRVLLVGEESHAPYERPVCRKRSSPASEMTSRYVHDRSGQNKESSSCSVGVSRTSMRGVGSQRSGARALSGIRSCSQPACRPGASTARPVCTTFGSSTTLVRCGPS